MKTKTIAVLAAVSLLAPLGLAQPPMPIPPVPPTPVPAVRHPLAGLTPSAPIAPAPSPVHEQQADLTDRFAGYDLEPGEEDEEDPTAEPLDFAAVAPVLATKPVAPAAAVAAVASMGPRYGGRGECSKSRQGRR